MIPRIQPDFTVRELYSALRPGPGPVRRFEKALAHHFDMRHAIAFPYGRTALYACLCALGRSGSEVVQPAYNCVVVAHATVKAGYRPIFVDAGAESPNQDPERMMAAIGPQTAAVMPVSIFGFAFDSEAICSAIRARKRDALIVLDACHAFDASWEGKRMAAQADAAVLSFDNEKPVVSLTGGALLTDRDDLEIAVRRYRDETFRHATRAATLRRWAYFLSSWFAYSNSGAEVAAWLKSRVSPIGTYLQSWHQRETIELPADNNVHMLAMTAGIGSTQLARATAMIQRRREIGRRYNRDLAGVPGLHVLAWPEPSTYAIYAARVAEPSRRDALVASLRDNGIQAGSVWSYVVPSLDCYIANGFGGDTFPHAAAWAESVINLPIHPGLSDREVTRIIERVRCVCSQRETQEENCNAGVCDASTMARSGGAEGAPALERARQRKGP